MLYDNPTLISNLQLPLTGEEGQLTFLDGIGLHQFLGGSWQPVTGGDAVPTGSYPLAQTEITSSQATLYTEENGNRTVKEVTIVTGATGSAITLGLLSGGETFYILKDCYLDAYLTTIIDLKIPLDADDALFARVTEGPNVSITVSGSARGTETLIVKTIATGEETLYTATANKTITNLILCNNAGELTTTTMLIRRSDSLEAASTFFNELQTAPGEVVLGDINTAIDTDSIISIDTDKPVTVLITA